MGRTFPKVLIVTRSRSSLEDLEDLEDLEQLLQAFRNGQNRITTASLGHITKSFVEGDPTELAVPLGFLVRVALKNIRVPEVAGLIT